MAENNRSSKAEGLVNTFLSNDVLATLPWHVLALREPVGLAMLASDVVAGIAPNYDDIEERDLTAAVVERLAAYEPLALFWHFPTRQECR